MIFFLLFACESKFTADIIYEGQFYADAYTTHSALAIREGIVVATDEAALETLAKDQFPQQIEGVIFPGFHDSHTHLLAGSFVMDKCLMVGVSSMNVILDKVETYAQSDPTAPWVVGYGWIFTLTENPSGVALDAIVPNRPAAIFDSSGHAVLVNSKAMAMAGIDANTEVPEGGIIVKDENGNPTGLLQESAIELISPLMLSAFDDSALSENLLLQIEQFKQAGITRISEILAVPGVNIGRPWIFTQLDEAGLLDIRVDYYIPAFRESDLVQIGELSQYSSSKVRFAGVKLWVDGSSGSGQSWSLEASAVDSDFYGAHYLDADGLLPFVKAAEEDGYQLKLHVNGDAAVRAALDAFERYTEQNGPLVQQHVLDHLVLIDDSDYDRISNLGLIASMQPAHALVGAFGEQADHWSDGRFEDTWDLARVIDEGITLALGTDWPVWPTVDLMVNLNTAIESLGPKGIPLETAINAYLSDWDAFPPRGCLHVGCVADFTVFESDPYLTEDLSELEIEYVVLSDGHDK